MVPPWIPLRTTVSVVVYWANISIPLEAAWHVQIIAQHALILVKSFARNVYLVIKLEMMVLVSVSALDHILMWLVDVINVSVIV